jgi:cytochrome b561
MLAIPVSGWLMSSAQGFRVVWFGVLPLPDLVPKDAALGALLKDVHVVLNYTMLLAVLGHVGAALQHHFIKKDAVLTRMLPLPRLSRTRSVPTPLTHIQNERAL